MSSCSETLTVVFLPLDLGGGGRGGRPEFESSSLLKVALSTWTNTVNENFLKTVIEIFSVPETCSCYHGYL